MAQTTATGISEPAASARGPRNWLRRLLLLADSARGGLAEAEAERLQGAIRAAEMAGLKFAFRARSVALAAIALWLIIIVPAPRLFYFLGVIGLFFVLGLVPLRLRRHRQARLIRAIFILLDVVLLVVVVVVPPPFQEVVWPIQTRFRFQDYLYLLIYLSGAALTYSPRIVLWSGICVVSVWSAAYTLIYVREDTLTLSEAAAAALAAGSPITGLPLPVFLHPNFMAWFQLVNQVVLTLIITGLITAAVWRARRHMVRQVNAEAARSSLQRYVSPDVAERLARQGAEKLGQPAVRKVAVLFVDIVDFTGLTEKAPPEQVIALLKSFQTRALEIVFAHGGTLDKFLGDGLMATFGTLDEEADCACRAICCAVRLKSAIADEEWQSMPAWPTRLRIGVGVHYGDAVVGNLGGGQRLEFTVVGDTVNVASRLERLTRQHAVAVAISHDAVTAAETHWPRHGGTAPACLVERGMVEIRGRADPIRIWIVAHDPG